MTRDEIISGLEREIKSIRMESQSKMLGVCITVDEAEDILSMLKEQEAVKPILEQDSMVCGACGHEVIWQKMLGDGIWADEELDYCPHCGREVKWDDIR